MAREAKTIITAVDKTTEGIASAIRSFGGMGDAAEKLGKKLVDAFSVIAVFEAGKKIVEFGADCVRTFGEVERTMTQLSTALGGNQSSITRATELIGYMSSHTLESKDSVEKLVAEMASLGKSDEQMDKLGRAALALSNVTGKDLQSSFTLINATYTGTSGKLARLVPEIGGLTKAQLEAGGAVDLLNAKLGAISDSMAGGISQRISNLGKSWEEFKEAVGADLAPIFSPLVGWVTQIVEEWAKALEGARKHREYNKTAADERTAQMDLEERRFQLGQLNKQRLVDEAEVRTIKSEGGSPEGSGATGRLLGTMAEIKRLTLEIADFKRVVDAQGKKFDSQGNVINGAGAGSAGPAAERNFTPEGGFSGDINRTFADLAASFGNRIGAGGSSFGDVGGGMPFSLAGRDSYGDGSGVQRGYTGRAANLSDTFGQIGAGSEMSGDQGGIGSIFGSLMKSVGPLISSFSSVSAILNPLQTIFAAMMDVVGPLVNDALAPLVGLLKIIGHALGAVLSPVITALGKVISGVVTVIAAIWNAIADAVNWALGWLGVHLDKWNLSDAQAAGATPSSSPSGTAASYTGSQSITFNFYNQGNVVGSNGLTELAMLIDSIIKREARYA